MIKKNIFIIMLLVIYSYSVNAQLTNLTLIGGVPSTTLTAPLAFTNTLILQPAGIPANYKVIISSYYYALGYTSCNVLAFEALYHNTNYNGHMLIYASPASCTVVVNTTSMTEIDLTAYDSLNVAQWRWYIKNGTPTEIISVANQALSLKAYPNPASNKIMINIEDGIITTPIIFNLYDNIGQLVISETFSQKQETKVLNIENLDNGIYTLQIFANDKKSIQKIIKE